MTRSRYARHTRRGTRAELLAKNMRRRTVKPNADPRDGYTVEARKGGWYALIGPDGQVGSSQRTEAEAWALLEG